ncbi:VOC family protein [Luteibacter flocculans]|uniref:VOC family protein n=1 Tax=Luteibacter flocculans TaxID=2780091 RepID=A0ABY4T0I4_9GAMM|nr:VOC family protein [Luteibacter flocculans]URL58469.1 VOC family protein [Luteibacter flocculans]
MKIQPYLFFQGNCEEAFRFYETALGGTIRELHRFKDMPPGGEGGMPPEAMAAMAEKIMHVNLAVGDQTLMGSDGADEPGVRNITISLGVDDVAQGRKVFDALAAGGNVKMPYGETFWAAGFGMLTDKFGVPWMINAGDKPSP